MPRGCSQPIAPPPEVSARERRVRERGPDDAGCIYLMAAFWATIRFDLRHGVYQTRRWLDSEGFAVWCDCCGARPDETRARLLDLYWPSPR